MPASAHAARIASTAMSNSERPRPLEYGVCPMPTIAAWSRTWFMLAARPGRGRPASVPDAVDACGRLAGHLAQHLGAVARQRRLGQRLARVRPGAVPVRVV